MALLLLAVCVDAVPPAEAGGSAYGSPASARFVLERVEVEKNGTWEETDRVLPGHVVDAQVWLLVGSSGSDDDAVDSVVALPLFEGVPPVLFRPVCCFACGQGTHFGGQVAWPDSGAARGLPSCE